VSSQLSLLSIGALCGLQLAANQAGPGSRPAQVPPSPILFAPDVVAVLAFAEGPTWAADGSLFFSDIANQRIMRVLPGGNEFVHVKRPCTNLTTQIELPVTYTADAAYHRDAWWPTPSTRAG
jgi:hypothetical protein